MISFKQFLSEAPAFNKGDVAEAILGAAVVATFMKSDDSPISKADVEKHLATVAKQNSVSQERGEEKETSVSDVIRFRVGLPKKAMDFISDKSNWTAVADLFDSVVLYCNSNKRLQRQAKVLRTNAKVDNIFVNSDGTGDQKGTKADIKLEVNGKKTKNQISLKVTGGEQFAQVSGVGFEKQIALWKDGLGLDVSAMKKSFDAAMEKFEKNSKFVSREDAIGKEQKNIVKNAMDIVYKYALGEMNKMFQSKDELFIKNLISFISKGISGEEEDYIELVKLEKGKFKSIRTSSKAFKEKIAGMDLVAEMKKSETPTIVIRDSASKKPLIRIRAKIELKSVKSKGVKVYEVYPRNYIEATSDSILYSL